MVIGVSAWVNNGYACEPTMISSKMKLFELGTCLRGANMFQQEKWSQPHQTWNPKIDRRDLRDLRNAGANLVNYSIPGPYDVKSPYKRRKDFFQKMDQLINHAARWNLFVILSFRTGPGRGEGDITGDGLANKELYISKKAQSAFTNMWKEVAQRYKTHKHIVGYDLLVEPHGVSRASWRALARQSIKAIRSVDSQTPILVSPHNWGVADSLDQWTPLPGHNLVYTVHQYEPYEYTHNNVPAPWSKRLNQIYKKINQWAIQYKAPIIVNEFGIKNSVNNGEKFMNKQLTLLENYQLNHAAWIWEVEYDLDYTYEALDFKENPLIKRAITRRWAQNLITPSNVTFKP